MNNVFFKNSNTKYENGDFAVDRLKNISLFFGNEEILLNNNIIKYNGTVKDFNDNLQAGIYNISGSTINKPSGVNTGFVIVFDRITSFNDIGDINITKNSYTQLQIICTTDKKLFFVCLYNNNGNVEKSIIELQSSSSMEILETPAMQYAMELEGVKQDYLEYSLEKFKYNKQLEAEQQAKQEAYQQALITNPNLTYEEFIASYPMMLPNIEEPTIPQSVQQFMKKYL